MANQQEPLLTVKDLKKYFPVQKGFLRQTAGWVKAVDGVNLELAPGETSASSASLAPARQHWVAV